jgi:hypothetical protein
MTPDPLDLECERLRKLAHEAPMNIYHEDHDGHRWVEQVSNAWAARAEEWMAACKKRDERKTMPECVTGRQA